MRAAVAIPDALPWQDGVRLGHGPMDEEHGVLTTLIGALREAPPGSVPSALDALARHVREHFGHEESWMSDGGFPARDCHAAEHRAVLASIDGVSRRVARGEIDAAMRLADALADWFPAHADYLDAPLAHWLCKRQHGGTPVVLHRPPRVDPAADPRSPPC